MKVFCCALAGAVASSWWKPTSGQPLECSTVSRSSPLSTEEFRPFKLLSVSKETENTQVFRFALPHADTPLHLVPASCITLRYKAANGEEVVRPYTPISRSDQLGYFDILVKKYEGSKMGQHLFSLQPGDTIDAKGPFVKLPLKPNQYKSIGMIAGGTGIAPMFQVARHLLRNPNNKTEISLIYASKTRKDVLLGNELIELRTNHPLFYPYFMVTNGERDWMGGVGHINKEVIKAIMPPPQRALDSIILVCGPPKFMASICGDKDYHKSPPGQGELRGYLKEMGYMPQMIYKF